MCAAGDTNKALALRHRDADAPDLALGADLHRLLVAGGSQRQVGGKSGRLDEYLDLAAAGGTLQVAENIPAFLAPVAGDAVAVAGDLAAQIEFVAVAGAMQILLQAQSITVDLVVRFAAETLGRSVRQRDRAIAGPRSVETGKWRRRLGMACRYREHQCGTEAGSLDRSSKKVGTKPFHIEVSH